MSVSAVETGTHSAPSPQQSYLQILKSTALMGGASVANVALSAVRAKAMAVMLGAEGVGLMGLYSAVLDLAQAVFGLGFQSAAVRQIAEDTQSAAPTRVATSIWVLRRVSIVLGVLGFVLTALLATPISRLSFGDAAYAGPVMIVASALIFRIVGAGQLALLQGMRQISQLARISVYSALASTLVGIPIIYMMRSDGVVFAIIAMTAAATLVSWLYARRLDVDSASVDRREAVSRALSIARLGSAFLASGVLTFGAAYAIRVIVLRDGGPSAAGHFQAAWAIGGLYAGFILQAMGTDFYPRLSAIGANNEECNRLVNEQARVSILLAGPGLLATLTLAGLALRILYSQDFVAAAELLRWICLGMMLRIVCWPMGFIIIARNARRIFFWTELAAAIVQVGLAWLLVPVLGLTGAGIAFFGLYVWHSLVVYFLVRNMTGFRWSVQNLKLMALVAVMTVITFTASELLAPPLAIATGFLTTAITGLVFLRQLLKLMPAEQLPARLGFLKRFL